MKRADPTNYPFQVGSLTAETCGNIRTRCAVTKPSEGKSACDGGLWPAPKALTGNGEIQIAGHLRQGQQMTRSQSERQGKDTGRRETNVRRHRKGEPSVITDRDGDFGRRFSVRWKKPEIIREENGNMHLMTRRCKRRWHVLKVPLSNWGDPAWFCKRISCDIMRKAESHNEAIQGVGDGQSSGNIWREQNFRERRAISLGILPKECRDRYEC